jgi:hypothetical protein
MRGWQKTPVFCKLRIAAALFQKTTFVVNLKTVSFQFNITYAVVVT